MSGHRSPSQDDRRAGTPRNRPQPRGTEVVLEVVHDDGSITECLYPDAASLWAALHAKKEQ